MEATIQSTNKAINIGVNVSTNVGALKANIQRGLQAIKQRVLSVVAKWSMVNGQWSITRLYRQELRMARAVARMIDAHPTLSNIWIGGWAVACLYLIFVYA